MFDRWRDAYVGDADADDPLCSPMNGDFEGLPPLFVTVGTAEMLFDQVSDLVTRLRRAEVDVIFEPADERVHDWLSPAPMFKSFNVWFGRIGAFAARSLTARRES